MNHKEYRAVYVYPGDMKDGYSNPTDDPGKLPTRERRAEESHAFVSHYQERVVSDWYHSGVQVAEVFEHRAAERKYDPFVDYKIRY